MNFETKEERLERSQQKITWITILVVFSWIITRVAFSQELPSWTNADHRTQGGGWIWFPGKYLAVTELEADYMAKGKAVAYLMEECQIPHSEIRFVERHVQEVEGKFKVYVRASITQKQCNEGKYGSKALKHKIFSRNLLNLYRRYKLKLAQIEVAKTVCTIDTLYCVSLARRAADMSDWYSAYIYAEKSCELGIKQGCNMVKIVSRYLRSNNL